MALEGQAQLEDAEAQQDHTHGADQAEDEITEVVDNSQRVAGGKGRSGAAAQHEHQGCINSKGAPALFSHGQAAGFFLLLAFLMKQFHFWCPP